MDKNNLAIIRQQFAQCVFNHKIHEKSCDRIERMLGIIKWLNILILFFIIIFLFLQVKYPRETLFGIISIGITVFEILFIFIQKEFGIEQKSVEHKKVALKYLELRDKYKNFIVDIYNGLQGEQLVKKRDLLQEQYGIIAGLALQTNYSDYKKAQLGLGLGQKNGEQFTWSDKEINKFLPEELST